MLKLTKVVVYFTPSFALKPFGRPLTRNSKFWMFWEFYCT
mgnify:CR=1 FL=1